MSINISINPDDSLAVVAIQGAFDYTSYAQFIPLVEGSLPDSEFIQHFMIDLKRCDYIDSSGLGLLVMLREVAQKHQASVTLRGCNENVLNIFKVANFNQIFKILDDQMPAQVTGSNE